MKAIATFFTLWALYVGYFALLSRSLASAAIAVLIAVTAVGLWLGKRWSQYPVYALAIWLVALWPVRMRWLMAFGWPYQEGLLRSVISVSFICVPLMFGVYSAIHVFRTLRK